MRKLLKRILGLNAVLEDENSLWDNDPVTVFLEEKARGRKPVVENGYEMGSMKLEDLPKHEPVRKVSNNQISPTFTDPLLLLIQETYSRPGRIQQKEIKGKSEGDVIKLPVADGFNTVSNTNRDSGHISGQEAFLQGEGNDSQLDNTLNTSEEQETVSVNVPPNNNQKEFQNGISLDTQALPETNSDPDKDSNAKGGKDNNIKDLLDIFREEEKEDKGPLTEDLEEIDCNDLLAEAHNVLKMIKTRYKRQY
jgi:hypothetical protein